ncbi:MAG: hypothetical protein Q4C36_09630 [Coriobacteriia bacterium]|nr:hypothetical protein [Coriobacteriia bacterium]
MALAITLLAGAFFLLGAAVAWRARGVDKLSVYSMAVAFGSLACVAVLDLLPEAAEGAEELGLPVAIALAVGGVIVLIALDHLLPHDHHHHEHHADDADEEASHIGIMAVLAISVHNLAEGAAIYAIASQDVTAGLLLALGVGLHNAPMGMLLYSAVRSGRGHGAIVLAVAALSTFVGGLVMFLLGNTLDEAVMLGVVCVALGMIVYILFAELLPAMIRSHDVKRCVIGTAIGAAFVLAGMSFAAE